MAMTKLGNAIRRSDWLGETDLSLSRPRASSPSSTTRPQTSIPRARWLDSTRLPSHGLPGMNPASNICPPLVQPRDEQYRQHTLEMSRDQWTSPSFPHPGTLPDHHPAAYHEQQQQRQQMPHFQEASCCLQTLRAHLLGVSQPAGNPRCVDAPGQDHTSLP